MEEPRFPFDYKYILIDVKTLLTLIEDKVRRRNNVGQSTTDEVEILILRIVKKFKRIGVFIATVTSATETDENRAESNFSKIQFSIEYVFRNVSSILDLSLYLNIPMGALRPVY